MAFNALQEALRAASEAHPQVFIDRVSGLSPKAEASI